MRSLICHILATLILIGAAGGCKQAGPGSLKASRSNYNIVIQQTGSEQLLLNIVRLRYRDTPYFLEVASVSTSFHFDAVASVDSSLLESRGNIYDFGAGVGYTERPTITYTPLQGDKFVTQLMSPLDLDTILLLYHSGWSIERIFRVAFQSINDVRNAPSASGPTPDFVPEYEDFRDVAKLLRELQLERVLYMGHAASENPCKPFVEIRIAEKASQCDQAKQLRDLLGLEDGQTRLRLSTTVGSGGKDYVAVVPRSLMGSLFYVSQGVEVPPEHEHLDLVTVSVDDKENRFDWKQVTGELMRIKSSERQPRNAYVAIYYRDTWFYIDDSDLTSKSTFSLLMQLFALQAGEVKSTAPILTLPVSR
jgi:hypothetical protein